MEKSSFFNSIDHDRRYRADDWAAYFASFIGNGVFPVPSTNLQVLENTGMKITVKPGKAWINGYFYWNTSDITLTLPLADGVLKRIDRVVIRLDLAERTITAAFKSSDLSASPAPPALQRDADRYEIALADGRPPQNKPGNPKSLRFLIAKKEACGVEADSLFVSVIEPYAGKSRVRSIEKLALAGPRGAYDGSDAFALRVTLDSGRTDTILFSLLGDAELVADGLAFNGFFAMKSCDGHAFICDGIKLGDLCAPAPLAGKVIGFTKDQATENEIVVSFDACEVPDLAGRYIYIDNDGKFNGSYRIKACRKVADGCALSIGDVTLINSWADKFDFSKGYKYNISEGQAFRIPLSRETGGK